MSALALQSIGRLSGDERDLPALASALMPAETTDLVVQNGARAAILARNPPPAAASDGLSGNPAPCPSLHRTACVAIPRPLSARRAWKGMPGRDRLPAPGPVSGRRARPEGDQNAQSEDQVVGQEAIQDHRDRQGSGRPRHEAPRPD